jgi:hypothetical protein
MAEGHELANHSFDHAYSLTRRSPDEVAKDLEACDRLLRGIGARVEGFRAPGYTHNKTLLREVAALGYSYDSSALPSPGYYLIKLGVMAWLAMRGRRSHSMVRGFGSFLGPRRPRYLSDLSLWQVPMSVTPVLRLPLIGTFLLAGPEQLARVLRMRAIEESFLHLELHGIDLADPAEEGRGGSGYAPELLQLQPELKVPLPQRRDRLADLLRRRGGTMTISDAVTSFSRS